MGKARISAALVAGAALAAAGPLSWPAHAQEAEFSRAGLVRGLLPEVVNITARAAISGADAAGVSASAKKSGDSFQIKTSAGAGFIVDPNGTIVTNWHVVNGAYDIEVTFSDGSDARAEVVNAARIVDIALLKVNVGHPLQPVRWGDSAKVEIGDPVLAIGNPLGVGQSVTAGIVSALNRNISDTPYDDFIQTDAPINHGNSGGPLFDMKGQLIGINTALISSTTSSSGLGFAIPSNDAHAVVDRLIHFGWVRPGYLGVKIQQLTPEMHAALGIAQPNASIVAAVIDGGPAAKAGLQVGDVIVSFNGVAPSDERQLLRSIAEAPPGEPAKLGILRGGSPLELTATIAQWPKMQWEQRDGPIKVAEPHWNIPPDLGIKVRPLTKEARADNDIPPGVSGVLVTAVADGADVARQAVAAGDVVMRVGDVPVASAADMQREIDRARARGAAYAMFLMLPKSGRDPGSKSPGAKWLALRIAE